MMKTEECGRRCNGTNVLASHSGTVVDLLAGKVHHPNVFIYHEELRLHGKLNGQDAIARQTIKMHHDALAAAVHLVPPCIVDLSDEKLGTLVSAVSKSAPPSDWPDVTYMQMLQRGCRSAVNDVNKFFDMTWPAGDGEDDGQFDPLQPCVRALPRRASMARGDIATARFVR